MTFKPNTLETIVLIVYVFLSGCLIYFNLLESMPWLADLYRRAGFSWRKDVGESFSSLITVAFFSGALYLAFKAMAGNWPLFKSHDGSTLRRTFLRFFGYGGLLFIGVGLYGNKLHSMNFFTDPVEFLLASIVALICSGILVLLDDLLGAIYTNLKHKKE